MPDLNRGVKTGALGGALWGLSIFTLSLIFGISALPGPFLKDLVTFMVGGVVFGVITGCMFSVVQRRIPVKSDVLKGSVIAVAVWGVLLCGALGLSVISPERYNIHFIETVRGVILVAVLGGIVGFLGGGRV